MNMTEKSDEDLHTDAIRLENKGFVCDETSLPCQRVSDVITEFQPEATNGIETDNGGDNNNGHVAITAPGTGRAKVTGRLCLAVFSSVMGSVAFGYNTGVINAPEEHIKSFINTTHYDRNGEPASDDRITLMFSVTVAIFAVGGMVGGLSAGWWADFFGRKYGMLLNNLIGVCACALMYTSRHASAYEMIIAGRFLVGVCCGLFTGLTPMYLSEISAPEIRGALGTLHQLGTVTGLLGSQVLGFPELLGNHSYWNLLIGLGITPCVVQLLTMPLCPDSPRYLLLRKMREKDARNALSVLRGEDQVETGMEEMNSESKSHSADDEVGFLQLFRRQDLRMPLVISIVMQISQQLSGINAIFYYSFNLFKGAGLDKTDSAHATSGVGGTMIVMTLVTIPLMDRVGRRSLHLFGLAGMFFASILITLTMALTHLADWLKIANIVASLTYVVFFAMGPGSIPWLIVSELFPQGPRPAAMSVSVLVNWVSNFAVGYSFPYMQKGLGDYSFLPFTGLLAVFWVFTMKYVPETKNRTIEDISKTWRKYPDDESSGNKPESLDHAYSAENDFNNGKCNDSSKSDMGRSNDGCEINAGTV